MEKNGNTSKSKCFQKGLNLCRGGFSANLTQLASWVDWNSIVAAKLGTDSGIYEEIDDENV